MQIEEMRDASRCHAWQHAEKSGARICGASHAKENTDAPFFEAQGVVACVFDGLP